MMDAMRRVLEDHPQTDEAIFWHAYAWHSGKGCPLYDVLCKSSYVPPEQKQIRDDRELHTLLDKLYVAFPPTGGPTSYKPVRYDEIEEGDVLIAGTMLCLQRRWPVKVMRWDNTWVVPCKDGFHRLRPDKNGLVQDFRR
jgi:hypothetical protein